MWKAILLTAYLVNGQISDLSKHPSGSIENCWAQAKSFVRRNYGGERTPIAGCVKL